MTTLDKKVEAALKKYDEAAEWHSYSPHNVDREAAQHRAAAVLAEAVRASLALSSIPEQGVVGVEWPELTIINPDIAQPTGIPYLDSLIHRVLDAQQDINFAANEQMSQPLADASALMDEVETAIRKFSAAPSHPAAVAVTDEVAIRKAIEFLGWVAESYDTHAKLPDAHPEEADAYAGSAEMARDHARALEAALVDRNRVK